MLIIIHDKHGVKRCYATAKTEVELINEAVKVASEYAVSRPDLIPLRVGIVELFE